MSFICRLSYSIDLETWACVSASESTDEGWPFWAPGSSRWLPVAWSVLHLPSQSLKKISSNNTVKAFWEVHCPLRTSSMKVRTWFDLGWLRFSFSSPLPLSLPLSCNLLPSTPTTSLLFPNPTTLSHLISIPKRPWFQPSGHEIFNSLGHFLINPGFDSGHCALTPASITLSWIQLAGFEHCPGDRDKTRVGPCSPEMDLLRHLQTFSLPSLHVCLEEVASMIRSVL